MSGEARAGLVDLPIWHELEPFVRVQRYDRDGGHANPRHRIELDAPGSGILLRRFLAIEMPCASCGASIRPIRPRQSRPGLYVAVTCGLDVSFACARSRAASREYARIIAAILGRREPAQGALF